MVVANADSGAAVAEAMTGVEGLETPSEPVTAGDVAFVEATIDGDVSSPEAFDTVEATRDAVHAVEGADALVGGGSAFYLDTKVASTHDNKVIIPIILVVVFVILMLLLRALLSPLILIATVVLSYGAALGISALLFKYVFGFAGSDPSFPLFAFVFLVALGIDYNIFLMTRVREETMHRGTRRGSLVALTSTGGVITSAGLVLAATFLVLGTIPVVFLAELGVAVALGVLLDTLIVRSVLVTAINLDLGGRIWWPSSLDRDNDELVPETRRGDGRSLRACRPPLSRSAARWPGPSAGRHWTPPRRRHCWARPGRSWTGVCAAAARVRDAGLVAAGRPGVVTYSPKVFVPVTRLCRDRCHYCTFVTTPGTWSGPGRRRTCRRTRSSRSRRTAPRWGAWRRCSRWATGPRTAGPRRGRGSTSRATTRRWPTSGRWRCGCWRRPGCCRT